MTTDLTTKFLLAAIAIGLLLNALPAYIQVAEAVEEVWGSVSVRGEVRVSNSIFKPLYVECVNC